MADLADLDLASLESLGYRMANCTVEEALFIANYEIDGHLFVGGSQSSKSIIVSVSICGGFDQWPAGCLSACRAAVWSRTGIIHTAFCVLPFPI